MRSGSHPEHLWAEPSPETRRQQQHWLGEARCFILTGPEQHQSNRQTGHVWWSRPVALPLPVSPLSVLYCVTICWNFCCLSSWIAKHVGLVSRWAYLSIDSEVTVCIAYVKYPSPSLQHRCRPHSIDLLWRTVSPVCQRITSTADNDTCDDLWPMPNVQGEA